MNNIGQYLENNPILIGVIAVLFLFAAFAFIRRSQKQNERNQKR